ncbi:MAG: hypothetical protein FWE34_04130 [Defluviitaleaceae bacterium]|nr:hypothetical protein [Defluviitaleaceae bacterium]
MKTKRKKTPLISAVFSLSIMAVLTFSGCADEQQEPEQNFIEEQLETVQHIWPIFIFGFESGSYDERPTVDDSNSLHNMLLGFPNGEIMVSLQSIHDLDFVQPSHVEIIFLGTLDEINEWIAINDSPFEISHFLSEEHRDFGLIYAVYDYHRIGQPIERVIREFATQEQLEYHNVIISPDNFEVIFIGKRSEIREIIMPSDDNSQEITPTDWVQEAADYLIWLRGLDAPEYAEYFKEQDVSLFFFWDDNTFEPSNFISVEHIDDMLSHEQRRGHANVIADMMSEYLGYAVTADQIGEYSGNFLFSWQDFVTPEQFAIARDYLEISDGMFFDNFIYLYLHIAQPQGIIGEIITSLRAEQQLGTPSEFNQSDPLRILAEMRMGFEDFENEFRMNNMP